jgi:hypothetical protein
MRTITAGVIVWISLFLSACAAAPITPYPQAQGSEQALTEMQLTRDRAAQNEKLAMFVLGANWCHDSTDFARLLKDPRVASDIDQHYEVQFINVGYLDHIREYVSPYGVPVIYGTPTVMVVEPHTNTLLNRDLLPYWRNASNLGTSDVRHYFDRYSPTTPIPSDPVESPALQTALASIDQFEQDQAQRIYTAYAALGPLLTSLETGQPASSFQAKWGNLAKMRGAITGDLAALREAAMKQDAAGVTDIKLDFPSYALFID